MQGFIRPVVHEGHFLLFWSSLVREVGDALAYVGMYSYSIYLWRVPLEARARFEPTNLGLLILMP